MQRWPLPRQRSLKSSRISFPGLIMPILIGIAGSFLAGIIGQFIGWYNAGEGAGFIASIIVAIILLVIYGKIKGKTSA